MDALFSTVEVLEQLGDDAPDRTTLIRWVNAGLVTPAMKLPGKTGAYLFNQAAVDRIRELAA